MAKFLYDWKCDNGHLFEQREDCEIREIPCKECDELAKRQFNPRSIVDQFVLVNAQWFHVTGYDFRDPNPDPDSLVPKKYHGWRPAEK